MYFHVVYGGGRRRYGGAGRNSLSQTWASRQHINGQEKAKEATSFEKGAKSRVQKNNPNAYSIKVPMQNYI